MKERFSRICRTVALVACCSVPAAGQSYTMYTLAGGGLPNQVAASSVGVQYPNAVAADPFGNLYVGTDIGIFKLDTVGILTALVDHGAIALAVDAAGALYYPESCTVRRLLNGVTTTVVGNGTCGYSGENVPAVQAQLGSYLSLSIAPNGDLYIVDIVNARVRRVSGGNISTVAGNGTRVYSGDGSLATNTGFPGLLGVGLDKTGKMYIADGQMEKFFVVSNGLVSTFAGGGGDYGDGVPVRSAKFFLGVHTGVVFDSSNNLYFNDPGSYRVRIISNAGIVNTVAGGNCLSPPSPSPVCDGSLAVAATLYFPYDVAFDSSGSLYIADSKDHRVRRVSQGIIETVVGNGSPSVGDGISAADDSLSDSLNGVATDTSGNVYFSDGNRIRKISDGVISTLAGSKIDYFGSSGDGGPAVQASLNLPQGVALDSAGNIFVADSNNNEIRKISASGSISTVAGNGSNLSSGDGGLATAAGLYNPYGVAVDKLGNLYIVGDSCIRQVSASTGTITTIAGTAGTPDYAGDNGPATAAKLKFPTGVAVDRSFNVYIADTGNNVIRKVSSGTITTIAGNGIAGVAGDGGPATNAQLSSPIGVAVDPSGNIYIADQGNRRVRKISNQVISTIESSVYPGAIGVDASGNVYMTDNVSRKLMVLIPSTTSQPPNLLSLTPSSAPVGASSINLVVTGSGFVSGNTVLWNGSPIPTTFVNSTSLTASVSPALFSATGTSLVSVGSSNNLTFTVTGPAINSLSPSSIGPGAPTFTITVTGLNFVASSKVIFNGVALDTTFNTSTMLTATVPASQVANSGIALVYVTNQNAASNEVVFTIGSPQLGCAANVGTPPLLRFEGEAELLGDFVLNCTSPIGGAVVTTDVTVVGPLASRILNESTNASEALLLIDDPAASQQVLNQNVFQGTAEGPNIVFRAVPITTPKPGGTRKLRIVNLRADAHAFSLGSVSQQAASIGVGLSAVTVTNGVQALGFVQPTEFKAQTVFSANNQRSIRLSYTERFASAFKTRVDPSGQQSTPGTVYNTESGFVNTTLVPGAGVADSGTRLFLQISGVLSGVSAYVSVFPEGSTNAQLISTDSNGAGPISPIAGSSLFGGKYSQVPISSGSGIAVWEVLSANPLAIETLTFDLVLTGVTQSGLGSVVLEGTLAPLSPVNTTSSSAPLPRFAPDSITSFIDLTLLSGSSGTGVGISSRYVSSGKGATATTSGTPPSVQVGNNLPFSFNLLNNGPGPATQVTVSSNLPPGLSFVGGSCTLQGGSCTSTTNADGSITVTGQYSGSLQQGQAPGFSFMATPTQTSSQPLSVMTQLSSSATDSNPDDNTIVTSFTVGNSAPPPVTVQFASSPANIPIVNSSNQPITSVTQSQYTPLPFFSVVSPQAGPSGTQYTFNSWSDGSTSAVRNGVPAPIGGGTFRAFFDTQYQLNVTQSGKGTVSLTPSAGSNYFSIGASVQIQATPAAGYTFAGFSGDVTSTTNPLPVVMPGKALNIQANFASNGTASPVITYDISGDGKQDLAVYYSGTPGYEYSLLSAGNGTFTAVGTSGINPGSGTFDTVLQADFNGDSKSDILFYNTATGALKVGLGDGTGKFTYAPVITISPGYNVLARGDFNKDGKADLLLYRQSDGAASVALSKGDGTFTFIGQTFSAGFTSVAVADYNGDGISDVILYNNQTSPFNAYYLPGDGTGHFGGGTGLFFGGGFAVYPADLNADGKSDFVLYRPSDGTVFVAISNGTSFTYHYLLYSPGFTSFKIGDVSGDGFPDLVLYNSNNAIGYLLFGDGAGNFPTGQSLFFGPGMDFVELRDFNGDGKQDVILYRTADGTSFTGISNGSGFAYTYNYFGPGRIVAR